MKKIGIYSGTFDPVHYGHVAFALEAIQECGLDKVFMLPEPRPRRKQGVKALEHRVAMLNLAIRDYDKLGSIVLEQSRFTPRETMPLLKERFKGAKLYMLIGDDMLDHLAEWPNVEELVSSISFIIGIRKYDKSHVEEIIKVLEETKAIRLQYLLFHPSKYAISSSQVKKSIRGRKNHDGLDELVAQYILENGLYSDGEK